MSNEVRGQDSVGIAMRERAKNGLGHWNQPATLIQPGASRTINVGPVRPNLMPGATTSGRVSNTARFNPMNQMNLSSIVAPMQNRVKEAPNERPAKRPRLIEPPAPTNMISTNYPRQPNPALAKAHASEYPVSLREDTRLEDKIHGWESQESDDPIDALSGRRPVVSKRLGTPSATTPFPSLAVTREKFEAKPGPSPTTLPHLSMKEVIKTKKSRIGGMKNKDGKSKLVYGSSKKPSTSLDFTGANDVLSQSSMAPKRRLKTEVKPASDVETISDMETSSLKRQIKGLFLGQTRYEDPGALYLDFDETDRRLVLQLGSKKLPILEQDINWMNSDYTHLYVCIVKGMKFDRMLRGMNLWDPKTLDPDFPFHTISLKFQRGRLNHQRISNLLKIIRVQQEPPRMEVFSGVAWSKLEAFQQQKKENSHVLFNGSSLSEADTTPARDTAPRPSRIVLAKSPVKRSTRSAPRVPKMDIENDEIMLVYPSTGTGSTQITRGEQQRLQPGEFLNDTLIEFGLRHWLESLKVTNPDLAKEIHIFSPFFYKKLKHKDPQAGYDAVKKWTSKVDIFQKRYLVVPINERVHWYLAIILYPENMLLSATTAHQELPNAQDTMRQDVGPPPLLDVVPETPESSLPASRAPSIHEIKMDEDVQMRDTMPPDEGILLESPNKARRSSASSQGIEDELLADEKEDEHGPPDDSWKVFQDTTWLLSFDSLGGKHPSALKTLRHYLSLEAKHKKGIENDSSASVVMKKVPSPVQPNFCDCGVYLIRTVETFLEKPDEFFQRLMDKSDRLTEQHVLWNIETFASKRENLFLLVSKLSADWRELKGPAETFEKAATKVEPSNRATKSPSRDGSVFTEEEDDDIEIVGEQPASRGRAARPSPAKGLRHAKRMS